MDLRKQKERELHNQLRDEALKSTMEFDYFTTNKKYYSVSRKSVFCTEEWMRQRCPEKKVLDYCCGNGQNAHWIAAMGPQEVIGIDISDVSVENAKRRAAELKVDKKTRFEVMDAENMTFAPSSFDLIFESGVLHHLDLDKAYSEFSRVLKADGECICTEALGHNRIIQRYREKTPHLRTKWETEHILKKSDIELARKHFNRVDILGFFHLASLGAVPFRNMPGFNVILGALENIDNMLLRIPVLKWQAWQVVFTLSEPIKRAYK